MPDFWHVFFLLLQALRLHHHSATPTWRNLKECVTLQPKFKIAETMIKPLFYDEDRLSMALRRNAVGFNERIYALTP